MPTSALLAMLLMPTAERAINADITYLSANRRSASTRPRSATVSLWDPQYRWAGAQLRCAVWGLYRGSDSLGPSFGS